MRQIDLPAHIAHKGTIALFLAVVILVVFMGSGCGRDETINAITSCPIGTPYDFTLGRCTTPQSEEHYYAMRLYRWIATLSQEQPIEFQLSFTRWMNEGDLNVLLPDINATLIELNMERVPGGLLAPIQFPTSLGIDEAVNMALEKVLLQIPSVLTEQYHALEAAAGDRAFNVAVVRVYATPATMLEWWRTHSEEVRFVQPLPTDASFAQEAYRPGVTFP